MPSPSPVTSAGDLATYAITSNGSPIPDAYQVVSVRVVKSLNFISFAQIEILDGSPPDDGFAVTDSSTFVPGAKIEISMGYRANNVSVFKGVVVKNGISGGHESGPLLTVECADEAARMTVTRKWATFENLTDAAIIDAIIGANGLAKNVASTTPSLARITQVGCTDWDFILRRARSNGMVVSTDAGKITVATPNPGASPVLTVTYGLDVFDFDLELDAQTQLASARSSAWDFANQSVISADAKMQNANNLGNLSSSTLAKVTGSDGQCFQSPASILQASLQNQANAAILESSLAKVCGKVIFQGSSIVNPGNTLELAGFGARFNGKAFVSGVTHTVSEGAWTTEVELGLDPVLLECSLDAAASSAGTRGLYPGVVKQVDQDPDGAFRVLVNIPAISPNTSIWTRLSTFYATSKAGAFFYPEIGDEVILGFMNDDPDYPVILGSVYSPKNPPGFQPDAKNSNKGIITKSQLKVTFDDQLKVLTLATPSGNSVLLSDDNKQITVKDQNGNSVTLSSSGIDLSSTANITIKAKQNVSIQAEGGDVQMKAAGNVSINGLSVKVVAGNEFSASGSAGARLASAGVTEIQGSMVKIN